MLSFCVYQRCVDLLFQEVAVASAGLCVRGSPLKELLL